MTIEIIKKINILSERMLEINEELESLFFLVNSLPGESHHETEINRYQAEYDKLKQKLRNLYSKF